MTFALSPARAHAPQPALSPVPSPAPDATDAPQDAGSRPALREAVRFLLVGGVATLVDIGAFNVLHVALGVGPLSSKVASTVLGGVVAFVGNRQWSFGAGTSGRLRHQALAFALVSLAALGLALLPLAVARYVLGMTGVVALNIAGNGIGLVLATAFRFWGCRRWVFESAPAVVPVEDEPVYEDLAA